VSQRVRSIERSNQAHGGITKGRSYDVTERWVREFFQNPARHLENLLGMDPSCSASKSCLTVAAQTSGGMERVWPAVKILVGLT
jgi:hypothetical protein